MAEYLGTAVWLWMDGQAELGVIAAATAMILKLEQYFRVYDVANICFI